MTLHHFTHPAWLGEDFWLSPEAPERFADWTKLAVDRLADRCRLWITSNEIGILGPLCYAFGMHPPGRRLAWKSVFDATGNLLAAHVRGYETIHERRPDAVVHTNFSANSIYEHDRLLTDLLLARSLGVSRDELDARLPIGAYLHWSLVDNYEWGSYQPRFGIHGVDRERGIKVLEADAMGRDSTGTYRRLIEGLRASDRSVLGAPD